MDYEFEITRAVNEMLIKCSVHRLVPLTYEIEDVISIVCYFSYSLVIV